ncbi:MAG: cation-transporting P-type ATPase, partial [Christensenella hongkongensis]|nr:cation-transporting P-type ATPase [Christensenella hongkongensis]
MKKFAARLEQFLELGGTKKKIIFLVISGIALLISIFDLIPLPFNAAWIAIVLCGVPIILEAVIGLITSFDIKADVLVSLALIASIC